MKLIIAPQKITKKIKPIIFLAGSIEMGQAEKWQDKIIEELKNYNLTILNPRRKKWNTKESSTIKDKEFKEQVEWEFKGLSLSDTIILNFDPKSKSPISLLELGLFASHKKIICCCPKEFWRYGNVEFICKKFKIPLYTNIKKMISDLKLKIIKK
ncbi:MAG TPA: nucleoside 2-deoxyribosyltransferase domain-containing protein [bacterium]|nr:nucleoside 2-deoxyribosyltransferase domain-containing protein [bacterium]